MTSQKHLRLRIDNTLLNVWNKQIEFDYTELDRTKTTFINDDLANLTNDVVSLLYLLVGQKTVLSMNY